MTDVDKNPSVCAVGKSPSHQFSKEGASAITLLPGLGIQGDAHCGATVKHRSRVKVDPTQPNLRQVHLIQVELLDSLSQGGFKVGPGILGENITTIGLNLLALPKRTLLHIGAKVVIQVTGLRNPCKQLDDFQDGLRQAVLGHTPSGELIRKCGIMGIVIEGGEVKTGDGIRMVLPDAPHERLECV